MGEYCITFNGYMFSLALNEKCYREFQEKIHTSFHFFGHFLKLEPFAQSSNGQIGNTENFFLRQKSTVKYPIDGATTIYLDVSATERLF